MLYKIILSGNGGQGIQLMSDLICRASLEKGWEVSHVPNYGLEQRGGVSMAFIQISDQTIAYPKFVKPDLLFMLSEQARERTRPHWDLADASEIKLVDFVGYEEKLKETGVVKPSYNIFFLGVISTYLEEKDILKKDKVFELLKNKLETKPGWEENEKAWGLGVLNK